MSFKLLDLFEVKFLTSNNLSDRKIINDIKVHSILNINKKLELNLYYMFRLTIRIIHV